MSGRLKNAVFADKHTGEFISVFYQISKFSDVSWWDKGMSKMELKNAAGISAVSIAKLGKGGNITTDVLLKICEALDCRIEDMLETIDEPAKK